MSADSPAAAAAARGQMPLVSGAGQKQPVSWLHAISRPRSRTELRCSFVLRQLLKAPEQMKVMLAASCACSVGQTAPQRRGTKSDELVCRAESTARTLHCATAGCAALLAG